VPHLASDNPAQADGQEDGGDRVPANQMGDIFDDSAELGVLHVLASVMHSLRDRLRSIADHSGLGGILAEPVAQPFDAGPGTGCQIIGLMTNVARGLAGHCPNRVSGLTSHIAYGVRRLAGSIASVRGGLSGSVEDPFDFVDNGSHDGI